MVLCMKLAALFQCFSKMTPSFCHGALFPCLYTSGIYLDLRGHGDYSLTY